MFRNIAITPAPAAFDFILNLVTDFGAPTNGVTDTSPAWLSFTSFLSGLAAGKKVKLIVPNHTYLFDMGHVAGISMLPGLLGGLKVVVDAPTGATFSAGTDPLASGYFIGIKSAIEDFSTASYINSSSIGATSVTLVTTAEISNFQPLQWICIAGMDLQGFGSPPNPAFFEYRQISSINVGSGIINFATPLAYQYLSTWPIYNTALKGPASVFPMPLTWDMDGTYNNITFDQANQNIYKGRIGTFNNCTVPVTIGQGIVPSVNQTFTCNNCDQHAQAIEADKCIESLVYNGGSVRKMIFQSMSSATNATFNNVSVPEGYIGTPRNITINGGSTTFLGIGCSAYGRSESVTVNNSEFDDIEQGGPITVDLVGSGFTMVGGVIKVNKHDFGPVSWAVPGTKVIFGSVKINEDSQFIVTAVGDDGTNTVITTNAVGGYPNIPLSGGILDCRQLPCFTWNGSGNFGCPEALALNFSGAQGLPLFSYSKRTYTKDNLASSTGFQQWGQLVAININVTTPYTGVQSTLTVEVLGQNGGDMLSPDHTAISSYDPVINLKQSGTRTITPISVSSQSGDTLTIPGNIWFAGTQNPFPNHDVSGENAGPVIEIEIITDQTVSIFP